MPNLNREELIGQIYRTRALDVRVPNSDLFGRKIFVKTTKSDLIKKIREQYKEGQVTNLRFREDLKNDEAFVEPIQLKKGSTAMPPEANAENPSQKRRGRPPGSTKNKMN